MKTSKAEQAKLTIIKLTEVARHYFSTYGYADASMEEMVKTAGLTRGALYHHYGNKEGLFMAVLASVQGKKQRSLGAASRYGATRVSQAGFHQRFDPPAVRCDERRCALGSANARSGAGSCRHPSSTLSFIRWLSGAIET